MTRNDKCLKLVISGFYSSGKRQQKGKINENITRVLNLNRIWRRLFFCHLIQICSFPSRREKTEENCRFRAKDGIPSETSFPSVTSLPSYCEIGTGRVFCQKIRSYFSTRRFTRRNRRKSCLNWRETRWNPSRIHIRRGTRLTQNPSWRVLRLRLIANHAGIFVTMIKLLPCDGT